MASSYSEIEEARPSRPWLRVLILIALAFVAGIVATAWTLARWDAAAVYLARLNPAARISAPVPMHADVPLAAPTPPARQAEEAARDVAELETRIGRIEERARAAAGNASRAEGLLVAFAARRAIDQGSSLGYVESLLQDRFGKGQPQAVATIISAARQPVTLEDLRVGLADAAPVLVIEGDKDNWWKALRRELAGMVVVRPAGAPSVAPTDRLARARRHIDGGHVDAALAEVARMPGRANAAPWIAQARRYVAARNALDAIETAALLDPNTRPAEVPGPAAPATAPAI